MTNRFSLSFCLLCCEAAWTFKPFRLKNLRVRYVVSSQWDKTNLFISLPRLCLTAHFLLSCLLYFPLSLPSHRSLVGLRNQVWQVYCVAIIIWHLTLLFAIPCLGVCATLFTYFLSRPCSTSLTTSVRMRLVCCRTFSSLSSFLHRGLRADQDCCGWFKYLQQTMLYLSCFV